MAVTLAGQADLELVFFRCLALAIAGAGRRVLGLAAGSAASAAYHLGHVGSLKLGHAT